MFTQGDIIRINFDPSAGQEITKYRPAIVLSIPAFNQHGMAIVCPITSKERADNPVYVDLPEGLAVHGQINTMQVRSLDLEARQAIKVDVAPIEVLKKCQDLVAAFIGR